jgi:WD40 repeat protein
LNEVPCQGVYCPEDFIFITVQSTKTDEILFSYKIDPSRNIIRWSPDSNWLITTGSPVQWGLTIYSIDPTLLPLQIIESTGTIESVDWSPDGNLIAATGYNGVIYLYKTDKILEKFFNIKDSGITP